MNLIDLFGQEPESQPLWAGKYKIPWDDPDFSKRMLNEHLSQDRDLASRRTETIDSHVDWIHNEILNSRQSRLLDLGCGPGFYSDRLAALGHTCYGIDFSPASIEYARQHSPYPDSCEYVLGDIRIVDYGLDYDLAMMIYGEFNAFPPTDAEVTLAKMYAALKPGGYILIEAHTFDAVREVGSAGNSWYQSESGLFSDRPHFCLTANQWHESEAVARTRFTVIDGECSDVSIYDNTLQAYSPDDYRSLLQSGGFSQIELVPAWGNSDIQQNDTFLVLRALKAAGTG